MHTLTLFDFLAIRRLNLKDWQQALAISSPAFRILCLLTESDDLIPLDPIWRAAGAPDDKQPADWIARHALDMDGRELKFGDTTGDVTAEDRGDAGIFADYQSAAWFAQELDPSIEPWNIIDTYY